jgi:5-keto 4-deoxyuronate isomerase
MPLSKEEQFRKPETFFNKRELGSIYICVEGFLEVAGMSLHLDTRNEMYVCLDKVKRAYVLAGGKIETLEC